MYSPLMTLDGNRIRSYLAERKKNKEWLANELGCSKESISRMIRTGRSPRAEILILLANVMGCSAEELMKGKVKRTA